jgi:hypothetical protein
MDCEVLLNLSDVSEYVAMYPDAATQHVDLRTPSRMVAQCL